MGGRHPVRLELIPGASGHLLGGLADDEGDAVLDPVHACSLLASMCLALMSLVYKQYQMVTESSARPFTRARAPPDRAALFRD